MAVPYSSYLMVTQAMFIDFGLAKDRAGGCYLRLEFHIFTPLVYPLSCKNSPFVKSTSFEVISLVVFCNKTEASLKKKCEVEPSLLSMETNFYISKKAWRQIFECKVNADSFMGW